MVIYKEIKRFRGYRFGSDGSAWTRRRKGPNPTGELGDVWKQLATRPYGAMGYFQVAPFNTETGKFTNISLHSLILEAFIGPRPKGMCARHCPDSDPTNNAITNLRWGTHGQNADDRDRDGNTARGLSNGNSKLSEEAVHEIREASGKGYIQEMCRKFGVSRQVVWKIRTRRTWTHI